MSLIDTFCCRGAAKSQVIMHIINFFMLVSGAILCGVSTWGVKHQDEIEDAVPPSAVQPLLVAGIFLFFLAVLGLWGSCFVESKWGRCFLLSYTVLLVLIMLLEIVAAISLLQTVGTLDSEFLNDVDDRVDKFIIDTWRDCCFNDDNSPITDYTCWTARHSDVVSSETCGDEELFASEFKAWLRSKLKPMAVAGLTFFLLQMIVSIASCCAYCHGTKKAAYRAQMDEDDDLELLVDNNPKASPTQVGDPDDVTISLAALTARDADESKPGGKKILATSRRRSLRSRWQQQPVADGEATAANSAALDQSIDTLAGDDSDDSII